jgi:hypothetical protein
VQLALHSLGRPFFGVRKATFVGSVVASAMPWAAVGVNFSRKDYSLLQTCAGAASRAVTASCATGR